VNTIDDRMREAWGEERIAVPTFDDPNKTAPGYDPSIHPVAGEPVCATTFYLMGLLQQRDAKGRQKYGTTLDRKDLSLVDWLQHQTEELLDGAGYAQAAKREAERLLEIKKLAHELLNSLEPKDCSDYVRDIARRLHQALLP
jgi:hypothetical protein